MSNLAKQQIFSRNMSNVKQLIGSMGDMDRTSVFFLFTSTTSTFTNKYDRLWPRKRYGILMGKRRQMPMFTSPKVATRHYSILNLCVSGWRFAREFAHFNSSAIPGKRSLLSHSDSYINGEYKFLLTVLQLKEPVGRRGFPRQYSSSDDECISYFCIPWRFKNKLAVRQNLAIWSRQSQLLAQ